MAQLSIDLPDALLLSMGGSMDRLKKESTQLLASQLFAKGYLSSGQAAGICGMSRVAFIEFASQAGIPVADLEPDEAEREFSG
jgi:predicted HTH domain antitoxin